MTLWHENLHRIISLIEASMPKAQPGSLFFKDADLQKFMESAPGFIRNLVLNESGRSTLEGETQRLRLAGVEATSNQGPLWLLQNWLTAARRELIRADDPINLQGSGPAPVVPRAQSSQAEVMKSALQWLLDDMHDAGETHNAQGDIFDSVEDAAAALVEAGGNLNWYTAENAEAYRARSAAQNEEPEATADALLVNQLRQRIDRLTDPDHRVVAAELRAIAAEKRGA